MRRVLPKYFTATQLARSGERLEGSVALADLPRLAAVAGIAGRESGTASSMPVRLALQADFDDEGVVRFRGTFSVNLLLQCQRCLDELLVALHAELRVAVVSSEAQEALLPVGEEGLLVPDGKVDLHQMLEEEVLLALPAAPVHEFTECAQPVFAVTPGDSQHASLGEDTSVGGQTYRRTLAVLGEMLKSQS